MTADNGQIVTVPAEAITQSLKENKDGSYGFTLTGGPYHGNRLRVYPPFSTIVYRNPDVVYELTPPVLKGAGWAYVHNPEGVMPSPRTIADQATQRKALNLRERYKQADARKALTLHAERVGIVGAEVFVDETIGGTDDE